MKSLFKLDILNDIFSYRENQIFQKAVEILLNTEYKSLASISQNSFAQSLEIMQNSEFFPLFTSMMNNFNTEFLYKSRVHGIQHIVRTSINAYIIAIIESLPERYVAMCIESAKYHDIGRMDDSENPFHGLYGAKKATSLDILSQYFTAEEKEIILFLITAHSVDDKYTQEIFENLFNISSNNRKTALLLLSVLKDADALDRFRLTMHSLQTQYLRMVSSKSLVKSSMELYLFTEETSKREKKPS